MSFNSLGFMLFFPIVVSVYFLLVPSKRQLWLLIINYYFYLSWDIRYVFVIVAITCITYVSARMMNKKNKKLLLAICITSNLIILGSFKYLEFAITNISRLFEIVNININVIEKPYSIVVPIGISFYTLQALGYVIDVYRKKTEPEENFIKYALYVSFFPTMLSGPIERSTNLLKQIQQGTKFSYDGVKKGLLLMGYGYFEKLLIANKVSELVNNAYDNYLSIPGAALAFAAILYGVQIYADFSGYSHIAIGAAKVMGFDLIQNFKQPYFARNIKEFWKRWHISLSSWFQDYVYISLGGSRKGTIRTYCNLMITFCVSAIWHGAGWKYIVWGGLHGIYQVVGRLKEKLKVNIFSKKGIRKEGHVAHILQICVTFGLVDFAWIFFSASSTKSALVIIYRIFTEFQIVKSISEYYFYLGTPELAFWILMISIVILFIIDIVHEKNISISMWLAKKNIVVRWIVYLAIALILVSGFIYNYGAGASTFLYTQF